MVPDLPSPPLPLPPLLEPRGAAVGELVVRAAAGRSSDSGHDERHGGHERRQRRAPRNAPSLRPCHFAASQSEHPLRCSKVVARVVPRGRTVQAIVVAFQPSWKQRFSLAPFLEGGTPVSRSSLTQSSPDPVTGHYSSAPHPAVDASMRFESSRRLQLVGLRHLVRRDPHATPHALRARHHGLQPVRRDRMDARLRQFEQRGRPGRRRGRGRIGLLQQRRRRRRRLLQPLARREQLLYGPLPSGAHVQRDLRQHRHLAQRQGVRPGRAQPHLQRHRLRSHHRAGTAAPGRSDGRRRVQLSGALQALPS